MNAQPFLVTGLPRTRTAWMSVFLTTGESICYHEPSMGMSDITEISAVYDSSFYKYVGVSDHLIGKHLAWLLENIKPATVIIDRSLDPDEIANGGKLVQDNLNSFKEHPLVLWVTYESLTQKRVMQKVFWHLLPGVPFDEARYAELERFNIQRYRRMPRAA